MKLIFGSIVMLVLLAVYVYLAVSGILIVQCVADTDCTRLTALDFNDRMASSLALIGGLVAALVVAELSVTKKGEVPTARFFDPGMSVTRKRLIQGITGLYLAVWLVTGLAAFFFGYLRWGPGVLPPLADLGQAWLGIAVGAGYAYFGIKQ